MKKILLLTMLLIISIAGFSQDIISLKSGRRLEVIVTEVTPTLVRYKLSTEPDGRVYFVYKDDVQGIMYQNGKVETFNQSDENEKESNSIQNEYENGNQNQYQNQQSNPVIRHQEKNYLAQSPLAQSHAGFAQGNYQDVVYLKNGSIIRGIIIEQIPNRSIKIQTADGNIFVYQMSEIEKLAIEQRQGSRSNSTSNSPFHNTGTGLQSGYKGIVELGYQIGTGDYGMDRLKLDVINGYQINPYFSLGLGVGLRYYFDADDAVIPIFADFRANFIDNPISPYLSLGIGYSFDATNNFDGLGFLLSPTIGVSFKISDKSALNVGIGYEMQNMNSYSYDSYGDYYGSGHVNSGAISIVVGISF